MPSDLDNKEEARLISQPRLLDVLETLGKRFHGTDLQFRRSGSGWPCRWRARLFTAKNERQSYRLVAYGDSAGEAILGLQVMVNKLDTSC